MGSQYLLYTMQRPRAVIQPPVRLVEQEKERCCYEQDEESNHSDEDLLLERFGLGVTVHLRKMLYCGLL